MKLKDFIVESECNGKSRAASPVIGVILMVAVTVILSAVVGTFVLGLGDNLGDSSPSASFEFDFDSSSEEVTITHTAGERVDTENIEIKVGETTNQWSGGGSISAGNSTTVSAETGDVVRVIWTGGENSAILSEKTMR